MWIPKLCAWYHGNYICRRVYNYHQYQLYIYLRMFCQRRSRRHLLATKLAIYTNSTKGIYMEVSGRTSCCKYWTAVRHYACYRSTTNKLTSFQKVLASNPLSHVQSFFAFFCSASTQTVLTCMVGSYRIQRSLAVEALNYWMAYKATLLCLTYNLQAAELIHKNMTIKSQSTV